jgi:hypothetical protein
MSTYLLLIILLNTHTKQETIYQSTYSDRSSCIYGKMTLEPKLQTTETRIVKGSCIKQ